MGPLLFQMVRPIQPLINLIAMFALDPYFLREIDASGAKRSIEWIVERITKAILNVGPSNIVQVIIDNVGPCKDYHTISHPKM
jgi:hypothetical protein